MSKNRIDTEREDRKLKKAFHVTYNAATVGAIISFLSLLITGLSMKLWQDTGVDWYCNTGIASFGVAFVGIIAGFACQSVNLYVQHIAYKNDKGPDLFRKYQRPSLFRQIVRRFSARQRVKPVNIFRPRANVRAYRRAPRPAFAFAPASSRNSGDSDSGDPPGPSSPASQSFSVTTSLKPLQASNTSASRHVAAHGICPAFTFLSGGVQGVI